MKFAMACVAFAACVGLASPAAAQAPGIDINVTVLGHTGVVAGSPTDHFLSFNTPVEVPGVGLTAGTYIFRFVAPDVIQVISEDRSNVYAMFFVQAAWRPESTEQHEITVRRVRDDAPPRITAIFPPNSEDGYEPVYPSEQLMPLIAMR